MIRIEHLHKAYGDFVAVDDLSLTAAAGEVVALLGPNGAGKTTTVSCIVGLLQPDRGRVEVCGADVVTDPVAAKQRLSYVPEVAALYQALTPEEYLALRGRLFGLSEATIAASTTRLLEGFGIGDRRRQPMAGFSKGMTQKVALAAALLTEPQALVLDEPLAGLDVETTMVVKELLRAFAARGGVVLYCSHLLDVVETVAHRVAVLDRGSLLAVGTMAELRNRTGGEAQGLEQLFQRLTKAADPVERARTLLGDSGTRG
ncbi:MAG: ABC transporter ATP-binding protein [Planctomycetota bacterium]